MRATILVSDRALALRVPRGRRSLCWLRLDDYRLDILGQSGWVFDLWAFWAVELVSIGAKGGP